MTHSRRDITDLLERHGLSPRRAFGQNFVVDPNTVRRIARLAGVGPGDHVVEIGAGLGSLTLALAETGARVRAVEIDRGIVPVLRDVVADLPDVDVVEGDALTLDWNEVLAESPSWTLVANLPYNVATPMVADLLDGVPAITKMLVMVQHEVGRRLAAHAGDDAYGAVSVKVSYWATARVVGDVPPTVFVPRPKVNSALVEIVRRDRPAVDVPPDELFALVRQGFSRRRRMLRGLLDLTPAAFATAGVAPESRAEELDVDAWGRLALAARHDGAMPSPGPAS
jgi:16S rRNA (adenine1518-N6/adenine1519-N6)-dimethyltransferase